MTNLPKGTPTTERLAYYSRVDPKSGCIIWTGATYPSGYGRFRASGKTLRAHRVAFECAKGTIPAGMQVCHHCDNPPCINVNHMFLGTGADNMADKVVKGRQARNRGESAGGAKLTAKQAAEICIASASERVLAARYGVNRSTIGRIKRGTDWSAALAKFKTTNPDLVSILVKGN